MDEQFEEARRFGYADIPSDCNWCFRIWVNRHIQVQVQTADQPTRAYWNGSGLIVEFDTGRVRRYHGFGSHDYVEIVSR